MMICIAPKTAEVAPKIRESTQVPEEMKSKILSLPGGTPIVVQTAVKVGKLQGNVYPLLDGLKRGDKVVVSNTALLRSGLPVRDEPANDLMGN